MRTAWVNHLTLTGLLIDTKKYGYRMLEKMGWMDGKGLGINEAGDTDFVKIKKKRDNSGECHVIHKSPKYV